MLKMVELQEAAPVAKVVALRPRMLTDDERAKLRIFKSKY
jgi:hypothetical protein